MQKQKQMATTTTLHLQMQFDIRLATSSLFRPLNHHRHLHISQRAVAAHRSSSRSTTPFRLFAFSTDTSEPFVEKVRDKPPICTADELHHVSVPNCDWRLALWRYHPPPQAPTRNHLLLLLSGVGTNAIGYDLSPRSSFARYMSGQGFDIWILEVRGFGLSVRGSNLKEVEQSAHAVFEQMEAVATSTTNEAATKSVSNDVNSVGWELNDVPGALSDSKICSTTILK